MLDESTVESRCHGEGGRLLGYFKVNDGRLTTTKWLGINRTHVEE